MPARLVVLASGEGSTLQALLDAVVEPAFGATIVAVGSDKAGVRALARAEAAGVETFCLPVGADRAAWDAALAEQVAAYAPDLVVCAGFMRILGTAFLNRHRTVNTHPALLPSFPGAHAVRDALAYGVKVTGVTVHLVDEGVDTGPVIAQAAVPVLPGDTEDSLHARIKDVEQPLYVDAVGRLARGGWTVQGRTVSL
ncbi:MAG: phosphoribosylglycinamide formyltransferase [Frankiales bacterium]|nr:phosphoribosylglycinamide formyltransferase [Frankiales bacterium]